MLLDYHHNPKIPSIDPRQRFRQTMRFGAPDKIPFEPGWPRESTLKAWHAQGLPEGVSWLHYLLDQLGSVAVMDGSSAT